MDGRLLTAPALFLDTNLMSALLIKAFAGGVLGGLNSLIGVFLGCLALGVAENLTGAYLSPSFADAITFIIAKMDVVECDALTRLAFEIKHRIWTLKEQREQAWDLTWQPFRPSPPQ